MDIITIVISKIEGLTSFNVDQVIALPVLEDQDRTLVSEKAEEIFSDICLENGGDENDIDTYIENGKFENQEILIELIWADTII